MSRIANKGLGSAFDLLLIFLCSLIQTLNLTPPPNNALLANLDRDNAWGYLSSKVHVVGKGNLKIICAPLVWRVWQVRNSKVSPSIEHFPEREDS